MRQPHYAKDGFLHMMFAVPSERYQMDPDYVDALNLLLILHADHGQNCSTSAVRMVGSSDVKPRQLYLGPNKRGFSSLIERFQ